MTVISFHGTRKVTRWQPPICHKNINNGTKLDHADFSSILENFWNSKIFRSIQNCDREWTEMIADDHVLNVEMPRFPNLFNISIFWHGSNANRSSLRYSYWFINPVWNQITEKIFLLVPSRFNQSDCSMDLPWKLEFQFQPINPYPWIFGTITEHVFWKKIQNHRWWRHS